MKKNTYSLILQQVVVPNSTNAIVLMAVAMLLPYFGKRLAEPSYLGQSFCGTLLIASSTLLSEMVVSKAAIRIRTIDPVIETIFRSTFIILQFWLLTIC
ncbi:hypothetical protein [Flavobacterium sp. DSP2-3-1]|uniref:hypothetical protein n=1 Tax=Flavobacterium sp. DSP2-3-1 TaxID=2804620 RepID=UPI003CEAC55C